MFKSSSFIYTLCLMFCHFVAKLPSFLRSFLASILAFVGYTIRKKDKKRIQTNIAKIYGLAAHSPFSTLFVKQCFRHQAISALEFFKSLIDPSCIKVHGLDDLRQLMNKTEQAGKGCILITAHLGSWELLGRFCSEAAGRPFNTLAKGVKHPALQRFLSWTRSQLGLSVLWTEHKSIQRDMIRVLKNKEWLAFVMDQKPKGRVGPKVDFFGRATEFVAGPAAMSKHAKAPMISAFCVREGPLEYRIYCKSLCEEKHDIMDKDEITQACAKDIEGMVRLYPEQWCWNYKRWRFPDEDKQDAHSNSKNILASKNNPST